MNVTQIIVNGLTAGAMLSLMAIGLTLIFGILGIVNFVHGFLFTLGAYGTIFVANEIKVPYLAAVLLSAGGVGVVGLLLQQFFFKRFTGKILEGAVFAIALGLFLEALAHLFFGGVPRSTPSPFPGVFNIDGVIISKHRLLLVIVSLLAVSLLHVFVKYSRYGQAMRATQQDAYAARLLGVKDHQIGLLTFAIGAALAGLAGGLTAPLQLVLPDMGSAPLLIAFVIIIVGGMGSVVGALWAAMGVGMVQSLVTVLWGPQAVTGVTFALALIVLIFRPHGLSGFSHGH